MPPAGYTSRMLTQPSWVGTPSTQHRHRHRAYHRRSIIGFLISSPYLAPSRAVHGARRAVSVTAPRCSGPCTTQQPTSTTSTLARPNKQPSCRVHDRSDPTQKNRGRERAKIGYPIIKHPCCRGRISLHFSNLILASTLLFLFNNVFRLTNLDRSPRHLVPSTTPDALLFLLAQSCRHSTRADHHRTDHLIGAIVPIRALRRKTPFSSLNRPTPQR